MFRFWGSETRGCEKTVEESPSLTGHVPSQLPFSELRDTCAVPTAHLQPPKRRRQSSVSAHDMPTPKSPLKRAKLDLVNPEPGVSSQCDAAAPRPHDPLNRVRDAIQHEFCTEILYKHNELRLIEQELAKCQVALEQLRRCHLIPYPVNCPTPDQMLAISSGKGPAIQVTPGEPVPRWAPPFGVVDGPYARHYAKWLIPDPAFDGMQPEWQFTPDAHRARQCTAEGRTTRNSLVEPVNGMKGRPARGMAGHKLQALSNGYPQPKEKAGPCILKRADGQTVKLVCLDCNRENFSSTQGFINHCRIAHKRDFKSHEEAAVHSGHPVDAPELPTATGEDRPASTPAPVSAGTALVHPFARVDMTEQEVYAALRSRLADSFKMYREGKLPGVTGIPAKAATSSTAKTVAKREDRNFRAAAETPFLSKLLEQRNFTGDLQDVVADARTRISLEDMTPGEDSEESEPISSTYKSSSGDAPPARTPVVLRMPARTTKSPAAPELSARPMASTKGRAAHMPYISPPDSTMALLPKQGSNTVLSDEDIDMEDANLSPHTLISNNAPSLVSDDGEYDDSDEGSSVSGASDNLEAESVSDVAEITLDDEHEPRGLRRGSSGASGAVSLRKETKDDAKPVTFMNPVENNAKKRKSRKA
ncbi:hypothetical protein S40285_01294 [Stachybotrys chlorohalonatus IBT 40285]|uniref:AHC1-like C2H2 zinc-finger domain-containing protein n=1 Tax=Stachybotrys chlorohalonatus (strain IBT 40285) TaxID=1283841 RepID=A0A084QQU5_STAC4|nr:hypothetical protein S40285_01294 [Stachybotrys chlorohalonata IBT 40285]